MTAVAWLRGIGIRGPGLAGWSATADILSGRVAYVDTRTAIVAPTQLPPAERRRVGKGVKIALEAGFEAVAHAAMDASMLPSVFTSSSGDGDNCDAICRALADDRLISPTRFHKSVHNAPSGYWGIASGSMAPSTSLCAFDDSLIAGFDDAMTQLAAGADAVLLVAYDAPYPEPLHTARPTPDSFGVAFVLAREPGPTPLARIEMDLPSRAATVPSTGMTDPAIERYRTAIPSARALPLLACIAIGDERDVLLEDARGMMLSLRVTRCNTTRSEPPTRTVQCA
ncbi:MAG: beta-ketoacyl synthase chain length factor [Burkholderiaceae bacterium]